MVSPIINPYARVASVVNRREPMGPQSQRRNSLEKRTFLLAASSQKKRKTRQVTLFGEEAFDPVKDCAICKARHHGYSEPHRGHHKLCWNNRRTKGVTSDATLKEVAESKALREHFAAPLMQHQKADGRHTTKQAANIFFAGRPILNTMMASPSRKKESSLPFAVSPAAAVTDPVSP